MITDQDNPLWVMLAQSQGCRERLPRILFVVALAWWLLTLLAREGKFLISGNEDLTPTIYFDFHMFFHEMFNSFASPAVFHISNSL